jgi:hypothetical protein
MPRSNDHTGTAATKFHGDRDMLVLYRIVVSAVRASARSSERHVTRVDKTVK